MKKMILLLMAICSIGLTYAQVGINTQSPLVGLHVTTFSTDGSTAEGIIAPNLTRAQLISKDAKYTAAHKGAFVFITAIDGTATTKTAKVSTTGYYYFDGVEWKHFNDKLQNADNGLSVNNATVQLGGNLTKATTITQGANLLNIISTNTSSSTAIFGSNNAALKLEAVNKGFMPPRVALTSNTDATTVPVASGDKGMVVFHTNGAVMEEGVYLWNGGSWKQLITQIPVAPTTQVNMYYQTAGIDAGLASGTDHSQMVVIPFSTSYTTHNPKPITLPETGSYAFNIKLYSRVVKSDGSNPSTTSSYKYICYVGIWVNSTLQDVSEVFISSLPFYGSTAINHASVNNVVLGASGQAGDVVEIRLGYLLATAGSGNRVVSSGFTTLTPRSDRTSMLFWKL